jgi:ATP synthase protein I
MENRNNKTREAADLARLTSVGIGLIITVMIGYFTGAAIDKHFHTAPIFTMVFILFGIGAGLLNVFRTLGKNGS